MLSINIHYKLPMKFHVIVALICFYIMITDARDTLLETIRLRGSSTIIRTGHYLVMFFYYSVSWVTNIIGINEVVLFFDAMIVSHVEMLCHCTRQAF